MGFKLHTVAMPDGFGPQIPDRLMLASVIALAYPAAAASVGTVGSVTAGSGYTELPNFAPAGSTKAAGGWDAIIRATALKVVGTPAVVSGGTSGFVTSDTVTLANGVVLSVTASAGVITSVTVSNAGSFTGPGAAPTVAVPAISTSGSGVGTPTFTLSWGLSTVVIDDGGNYSVLPTSWTITPNDGNGTGAALAIGAAVATGAPLYRAIAVDSPAATCGVIGCASTDCDVQLNGKSATRVSVKIQPRLAANAVTAGTLDALIWA
jgi:hypothetical protein